ncbi:complex I NDUFA9 subunit family protein [Thermaurantiacus sp.]
MDRLVLILGGSGFVGRALVERLARRGARLRVAVRNRSRAMRLKVLADLGQIDVVAADITRPETLPPALAGADWAVNLVGILGPSGRYSFEAVQAEGPGAFARAAAAAGVRALAHVSAIGADPASPSAYGRTKGEGEVAVRAAFPCAAILRPSLIFGEDDGFTNRFAALIASLPLVPVIAPATRFQPVFVGDVADAIIRSLERQQDGACGETFELGGPEVMTMRAINAWLAEATGNRKPLIDVPDFGARLLAAFGSLPGAPLTRDQYRMLQADNVVSTGAKGLTELGVEPLSLRAAAPQWLERFRPGGRFSGRR